MTYEILGPGALDYLPCRYGASKLKFRGPEKMLEGPYVAFLGGTTTFGKFIEKPYPLRVEHMTGVPSVNFGQMNAGLEVFAREDVVLNAARSARITVLEAIGAANMSNRFYRVHPRRNDRFLRAGPQLRLLYPEVDFSQFNFTGHMLRHLYGCDPQRFGVLREVLQRLWVRRMCRLAASVSEKTVLLRFGAPQPRGGDDLVTPAMLAAVAPEVSAVVTVEGTHSVGVGEEAGLVYHQIEEPAARSVVGPAGHEAAALALRPVLDSLM
jgi:hypothetical protein